MGSNLPIISVVIATKNEEENFESVKIFYDE